MHHHNAVHSSESTDSSTAMENSESEQHKTQRWWVLKTRNGMQPLHRVLMDNWQSGVTVAMVSVPLSISLGIASVHGNDPNAPTLGVATAFWGGLSAGIFGSSDLNIVGPAGALSGMLKSYTVEFGGAGVLPYLSMMSAMIIFCFWLMNLQKYLLLMPKAVFEGFTMAVAIIIGFGQINMALDLHPQTHHEHFYENFLESLWTLPSVHPSPSTFFVINLFLLLGLVKFCPTVRRVTIPWTVLIPLVSIVFGYLAHTDRLGGIHLPTLKDKFGELEPHIAELPEHSLLYYVSGKWASFISASFSIAFVAVLETLISAKIAEHKTGWRFSDSRETFGLAMAHGVCGVVGALPPTGVFVRTSLNAQLGATHRISQIINSVMVFVISVIAMPVFSFLPQACIAALLVFASIKMAPLHFMKDLWRNDRSSFALLLITCFICVFSDPVYGLVVGMVVALLKDAAETALADARLTVLRSKQATVAEDEESGEEFEQQKCTHKISSSVIAFDRAAQVARSRSPLNLMFGALGGEMRRETADEAVWSSTPGSVVLYEPVGPLVYLAGERHLVRLKALADQKPRAVVVSLEMVTRVDAEASDFLGQGIMYTEESGVRTELVVPDALCEGTCLCRSKWLTEMRARGHIFTKRDVAVDGKREEEGEHQDLLEHTVLDASGEPRGGDAV